MARTAWSTSRTIPPARRIFSTSFAVLITIAMTFSLLAAQTLDSFQNALRHRVHRGIPIYLGVAAQPAIMLKHRRRLFGIGAHALGENCLRVVGALLEDRLVQIADGIGSRRL